MDRLSADELKFHLKLMAQRQAVEAAVQFWQAHLAQEYRLNNGDSITPTGEIVRAAQAAEVPQAS